MKYYYNLPVVRSEKAPIQRKFLMLMKNCHMFIDLKQHISLISQFLWIRGLNQAELSYLLRISMVCDPGFHCAAFSCGGQSWEESISKLMQVVGRIYFLCSCRTESSDFFWLLLEALSAPRSCLRCLEAAHCSFSWCFPNFDSDFTKSAKTVNRKQSVSNMKSFFL